MNDLLDAWIVECHMFDESKKLKMLIRAKTQQLRRLDPAFVKQQRIGFKKWYYNHREENIASSLAWNKKNKDRKNASNRKYSTSKKGHAAAKARRDKKKCMA